MPSLGANVIVVGGSSGMGLATAQLAKEQCANVTIASRSSERLWLAVQQLGDVRAVIAAITSDSDVERIFRDLDRVDHVFILAGGYLGAKVIETDLDCSRSDLAQRF